MYILWTIYIDTFTFEFMKWTNNNTNTSEKAKQ